MKEKMKNHWQQKQKLKEQRGGVFAAVLFFVLLLFVFWMLVFWVFGKVVPPNTIGVRQNYFSIFGLLQEGFSNKGLEAGLHWRIPQVSNIILLPRDFQLVHFTDAEEEDGFRRRPLEVQTSDGPKVKVDVSLIVRLYPKAEESLATSNDLESVLESDVVPFAQFKPIAHGGPRDLVVNYQKDLQGQLERFSQIAENELRQSLAKLSTADFYNPVLREQAALEANDKINKIVAKVGLELSGTLIRRYVYSDQNINDQIFAKNLQEQSERLNKASSLLAAAKALTEQQRASWDAKIQVLQTDGETQAKVTRSEADLYETSKVAEGDLMVAKARAAIDEARANILNQGYGGDLYVIREMAPLMKTLTGGLVTGIDPFDLRKWIEKLGAKRNALPQ